MEGRRRFWVGNEMGWGQNGKGPEGCGIGQGGLYDVPSSPQGFAALHTASGICVSYLTVAGLHSRIEQAQHG